VSLASLFRRLQAANRELGNPVERVSDAGNLQIRMDSGSRNKPQTLMSAIADRYVAF
jgi:hypothetical protein